MAAEIRAMPRFDIQEDMTMFDPITSISAITLVMRGLRQGKKAKYYKDKDGKLRRRK